MKKILTKIALLTLLLTVPALSHAATLNLWQGGTGQGTSSPCELLEGTSSQISYSRLPCGSAGTLLESTGSGLQYVATSSLNVLGAWGSIIGNILNQTDLQNEFGLYQTSTSSALTYPNFTYASSTFISFKYASSTFPSFTYGSSTYATILNYPTYSYASSTYYFASNPSGYITNSVSNLTNYPTYTYGSSTYLFASASTSLNYVTYPYASSTYYFASNPANYITAASLAPYVPFTYASSTFVTYPYASSTFNSFAYSSSTFVNFAYASNTFATAAAYVPYTGATTNVNLNAKNLTNVAYLSVGTTTATIANFLVQPVVNIRPFEVASSTGSQMFYVGTDGNLYLQRATTTTKSASLFIASPDGSSHSSLNFLSVGDSNNYGSNIQLISGRANGGTGNQVSFITGEVDDPTGYPQQNTHITFNTTASTSPNQNAVLVVDIGSTATNTRASAMFANPVGIGSTSTAPTYMLDINPRSGLGTNLLRVSSSTGASGNGLYVLSNGNVGIGTTTPSYTLDVAGTIHSTGTLTVDNGLGNSNAGISLIGRFAGAAQTAATLVANQTGQLILNLSGNQVVIGANEGGGSKFQVAGGTTLGSDYVTALRSAPTNGLLVEGLTGIGSTSPSALLTVESSSTNSLTAPLFTVASSSDAADLTVLTNGNVGIGTSTPLTALSVIGTSTTQGLNISNLAKSLLAVDAFGNVIATSTSGLFGNYVPYTGATGAVNLNGQNLTNVNNFAFTNASGTALSLSGNLWVTGTSTLATTTLSNLAVTGGSVLAVNGQGQIIATSTSGGTVTSVNTTVPTGFVGTGCSYTTSGTCAITILSGYTGAFTTASTTGGNVFGLSTTSSSLVLHIPATTGSGTWVQSVSPTLTTPILGNASGTALTLSGNEWLTNIAPTGGSFLAVNGQGLIVATTTSQFASTTGIVADYVPYTGANANVNLGSNTLTLTGQFNFVNASGTALTLSGNEWLTALAQTGGTFLAVNPQGLIVATTSPYTGGTVTSVGIVPVTGQTASAAITTSGNITISTTAGYTSAFTTASSTGGTVFGLSTTSSSIILDIPSTTGSGNWVQATSPTLVTPTLGNASGTALTLSNELWVNATSTLQGLGLDTVATAAVPLTVGTSTPAGRSASFAGGIQPRIISYMASTSITVNTDILDIASTTFGSVASTTINNPSGTPFDGQMWELKGNATTSLGIAWGTMFATSTDVTSFPTLTASGTNQFLFQYNAAQAKWLILGQ